VSCAKNGWTDRDAVWILDSSRLREPGTRWGSRSQCEGVIFTRKVHAGHFLHSSAVSYAKWLNRLRCRLGCGLGWAERNTSRGAHWRNLANTIESSVCGSNAALCQITLTTWSYPYTLEMSNESIIHRLSVTQFSVPAVFSPWCGTSSDKCLLLWHHFLSKMVIIWTFSWTNWFNFIRMTRQIFTT